mmetsp:Transcript_18035/g.29891  ORF Transcript_18035/g.29891 Transcript_18035/m.29891 type:complete len:269 (-) Transcript_18035:1694-2500(-)
MIRFTYGHFLLIATILVSVSVSAKKERNQPHKHQGIMPHYYEPGPFDLSLKDSDESDLKSGKSVMKQTMPKKGDEDAGGGVICVQDIEAPKQAVWNQILRMDDYTKKVPKVLECKNYDVHAGEGGCIIMKTRQKLGVLPGYSYENYYEHTYAPEKDSLVWRLDYNKNSDFDDVAGHWHVEEHPSRPGCSRVFYACDIKLRSAVPGPVLNFISKSALKQATAWVKKESEKAPTNTIPAEYGGAGGAPAKELETAGAGRFSFANKLNRRQ